MTNKELKQTILAEIERLKAQLIRGACAAQIEMETNCKDEAYNEIANFINSLPDEECDGLEEAALWYYYGGGYIPQNKELRQCALKHDETRAFIAGAKWQKEQMMKEAVEGEVENGSFGIVYLRKNLTNDGYSTGDKVKLIIVKDETRKDNI